MDCDVCKFQNDYSTLVLKTEHWKVSVMDEQSCLGRCVIACNRHCPSLSDLTNGEWADFVEVIKKLEKSIKMAFGANVFNWACLMNNAFRKEPFNPHVHWHVRPRYKNSVNFAGITFTDPDFGEHYNSERKDISNNDTLQKIVKEIKANLN